ncbi:MAG: J domain-containing protein [Alkalispirochaeta sp.]
MRRYLGRGLGAVAGLPAGPGGVLFGFLVGALFDQYLSRAPLDGAFARYLARPEREVSPERVLLYATATCTAVVLGSSGGTRNEDAIQRIATRKWPTIAEPRGRQHTVADRRRRALRFALTRGPFIAWQPVVHDIARRRNLPSNPLPRPALETLLEMLVDEALRGTVDGDRSPHSGDRDGDLSRGGAVTDTEGYRLLVELAEATGIDLYRVPGADRLTIPDLDDDCRILGVSPEVSLEELKRVYRILVSNLHPDTAGALDERRRGELSDALIRVRDAYDRVHAIVSAREGRDEITRRR